MYSNRCPTLILAAAGLTALMVLLLSAALIPLPASGAVERETVDTVFTVNSNADPGDGVCNSTNCTLREAITAANAPALTDPVVIEFDLPAGSRTITLASFFRA